MNGTLAGQGCRPWRVTANCQVRCRYGLLRTYLLPYLTYIEYPSKASPAKPTLVAAHGAPASIPSHPATYFFFPGSSSNIGLCGIRRS